MRSRSVLAVPLALALAACGGSHVSTPPAPAAVGDSVQTNGAVSTIGQRDLKYAQYSNMEELLARVPGVQVLRSETGYSLRVRGTGSLNSNNEPLVVLDGMPLRLGATSSSLNAVQPRDVVRVDVLKDTGSTAYYGSAGANGVIVITTKRGKQ